MTANGDQSTHWRRAGGNKFHTEQERTALRSNYLPLIDSVSCHSAKQTGPTSVMTRRFTPGDRAYVNGKEVVVVCQVLFNQPAYRVRGLDGKRGTVCQEWVVDGTYLSSDPSVRTGLLGNSGSQRDRTPPRSRPRRFAAGA